MAQNHRTTTVTVISDVANLSKFVVVENVTYALCHIKTCQYICGHNSGKSIYFDSFLHIWWKGTNDLCK